MNAYLTEAEVQGISENMKNGYISVQYHPENRNVVILNYNNKCMFEGAWNEYTIMCRGLIVDMKTRQILARPFPKFFEYDHPWYEEEMNLVRQGQMKYRLYEKLDGSLGVMYWMNDKPYIASRGSFTSVYAQKANEILYTKYAHLIPMLRKYKDNKTFLFEILFPDNQIVIDYHGLEDIIQLAVIGIDNGCEYAIDAGFNIVKPVDNLEWMSFDEMRELNFFNKEGYVVVFENGKRAKIKFDSYKKIHNIVVHLSELEIWRMLKNDFDLSDTLQVIPERIYKWMGKVVKDFLYNYRLMEVTARNNFKMIYNPKESQKEFALKVTTMFEDVSMQNILFSIYHRYDYSKIIWDKLRPKMENTLRREENE